MRKAIKRSIVMSVAATLASQVHAGEFPNAVSVTASASAIGSDAGYNLGVVIPFSGPISSKEEQTALAFNFGQYFLGTSNSYFLAQFGIQNRIYETGPLGGYLKSGGFVFPAQDGLDSNLGLNIALGLEFKDKGNSHLALCSELGYFLPLIHQTSVARGVGLNLGAKFYF